MRIIKIDPDKYEKTQLAPAVETLVRGGLVVFPTETVYGIAVNAKLPASVQRLIRIKKSPPNRHFTYHIADIDNVYQYVNQIPNLAHRFISKFWPGPLTLLLEAPDKKTVGIRLPDHPIARDLIRMSSVPVVASSANIADQPPPRDVSEIIRSIGYEVDVIIDNGQTSYGKSSTIVKVSPDNRWEIIREGAIKKDDIKRLTVKTIIFVCTGNTCRSPMAVGLFKKMLSDKLGIPQEALENKGYKITSGGTAALYGMPASSNAIKALSEYGSDISGHQSQPVTLTMIEEADLIYVMTKNHLATLKEWMPSAASKIFLLDPEGEDIADPISGNIEVYRQCAVKIKRALESVMKNLESGS